MPVDTTNCERRCSRGHRCDPSRAPERRRRHRVQRHRRGHGRARLARRRVRLLPGVDDDPQGRRRADHHGSCSRHHRGRSRRVASALHGRRRCGCRARRTCAAGRPAFDRQGHLHGRTGRRGRARRDPLAASAYGPRVVDRDHRRAGRGEVDADRPAGRAAARHRRRGGRARGRSDEPVQRRRDPRRPCADAEPHDRSRRVHPLDGDARAPRRARAGGAAGGARARRGRQGVDRHRDGRRRPGRGRDRRARRHDCRRGEPGVGRRGADREGRAPGDRRRLRRQQGRPAGRGGDRERSRGDARAVEPPCVATADRAHRRDHRRGRSTSCSTRSPRTRRISKRRATPTSGGRHGCARSCVGSSAPRCWSAPPRCARGPRFEAIVDEVADRSRDPYSAAEELLAE